MSNFHSGVASSGAVKKKVDRDIDTYKAKASSKPQTLTQLGTLWIGFLSFILLDGMCQGQLTTTTTNSQIEPPLRFSLFLCIYPKVQCVFPQQRHQLTD
jgi:hypothetical protein